MRRATSNTSLFAFRIVFLSTLSLRRATRHRSKHLHRYKHFYPRSPCGERRATLADTVASLGISIHALLAESDFSLIMRKHSETYFYPRSPCGERPTPAGRSAFHRHFYPRSPCGERHGLRWHRAHLGRISIHALLAESDRGEMVLTAREAEFLSTLSLRRATTEREHRAGPRGNFYPRSPCGERHPTTVPALLHADISIHALLAESDWARMPCAW